MVCLVIMIVSIMDSIFISYMLHLSSVKPEVPKWLKLWVLKRLAYVLRISTHDDFTDSMTLAAKNRGMDMYLFFFRVPIKIIHSFGFSMLGSVHISVRSDRKNNSACSDIPVKTMEIKMEPPVDPL